MSIDDIDIYRAAKLLIDKHSDPPPTATIRRWPKHALAAGRCALVCTDQACSLSWQSINIAIHSREPIGRG